MKNAMKYLVYGLVNPRDGNIFYIGKSCSGLAKAKRHSQEWSLNDKNHMKNAFIRDLLAMGLEPEIVILDIARDKKSLIMKENVAIGKYRKLFVLLNRVNNRMKHDRN